MGGRFGLSCAPNPSLAIRLGYPRLLARPRLHLASCAAVRYWIGRVYACAIFSRTTSLVPVWNRRILYPLEPSAPLAFARLWLWEQDVWCLTPCGSLSAEFPVLLTVPHGTQAGLIGGSPRHLPQVRASQAPRNGRVPQQGEADGACIRGLATSACTTCTTSAPSSTPSPSRMPQSHLLGCKHRLWATAYANSKAQQVGQRAPKPNTPYRGRCQPWEPWQ